MITDKVKEALRNRAATFYLCDGEYDIEEQLKVLERSPSNEVNPEGVDPVDECVYWNVKELLKAIDELAQDFAEVYEDGYKAGSKIWTPNIQHIKRPI